jgi:hypothetical protein
LKLDQSYGLKIAELRESEMIEDDPAKEYPALLLGNRGVEKRFGKKGEIPNYHYIDNQMYYREQ